MKKFISLLALPALISCSAGAETNQANDTGYDLVCVRNTLKPGSTVSGVFVRSHQTGNYVQLQDAACAPLPEDKSNATN